MKKLFCIFMLVLLLTGCQRQQMPAEGYTFTDDLGRTVTVSQPERVATLLGSYADVWHLAGGKVSAAADDAWEDFDLPLDQAVKLGSTKRLSLERLLGAQPDFVIASTNTPQHVQWQQTLEQAGIPVAYFSVTCFEDYLRMLKICTDITGCPERYEQYGSALQEEIDEMLRTEHEKQPPTVLVMRASAGSIRAKNSEGTVLGTMLRDFGCVNIADSDKSLLENLSVENILLQDPDMIFFVQTADDMQAVEDHVQSMFRENPLWNELTAVKQANVFFMEKALYNMKPNARWAEAYEKLEKIIYETK